LRAGEFIHIFAGEDICDECSGAKPMKITPLLHEFPTTGKPSEGMICARCGVEIRLVPKSERGAKHGRAAIEYRKKDGAWQEARIPCNAS
jgi:hypothetical protein